MCRACGGHGCGQCRRRGFLQRDCGLYPGPGVDPRGVSCKACFTKPRNCNGPPYGCPNVNYYPCGFGGKTYSCRGREPWDIKQLNHVWNYRSCCHSRNRNNIGGGAHGFDLSMAPPGCPPPHPHFSRLGDQPGSNVNPNTSSGQTNELMGKDGEKPGVPGEKVDPCLAEMNKMVDLCLEGMTNNMADDPCETEEEDDEDCEDEVVTQVDVSKYLDKIQTFIMTEVRGDAKHTIQCIKDVIRLRINVLGTASSLDTGNTGTGSQERTRGKQQASKPKQKSK